MGTEIVGTSLSFCLITAAEQRPSAELAVKFPSAFSARHLRQLRDLFTFVEADEDSKHLMERRSFGTHGGVGHETVFVHGHLNERMPNMLGQLWELAEAANLAAGWKLFGGVRKAVPRCLELIKYHGGLKHG